MAVVITVIPDAQAAAAQALPRDYELDGDGDLSLDETGDWSMNSGAAGVASDLQARLSVLTGDYFKDTGLGLPRELLLGGKFNKGRIEDVYRKAMLETPSVDVVEMINAEFDYSARQLSVRFRVRTDFGALLEGALKGVT